MNESAVNSLEEGFEETLTAAAPEFQLKVVILDFDNVEVIGQAFADEVFRVFGKQHPHIEVVPNRTNKAVQQMIQRALCTQTSRMSRQMPISEADVEFESVFFLLSERSMLYYKK